MQLLKKYWALFFLNLALFGCVSNSIGLSQYTTSISPEELKDVIFIKIPAANNPVSNAMVISSLNLGVENSSVKAIKDMLNIKGKDVKIGIIGQSSALNAATLKAALTQINVTEGLGAAIYFVAPKKYQEDLQSLAESKKIKLIYKVSN